jgi:cell division septal protein FtsQ
LLAKSGLVNRHVFAVDPGEAATRIGEMPGVVTATVTLVWPNQIAVRIGEDGPIAVWEQSGDQYWIDELGQLTKARAETTSLLVIRSEIGSPVDEDTFVGADVLAGALQLRELRPNIDVLYYRPGSGLSYQDGRGWRAYFGTGTDMSQKLAVYETLVEDLQRRGIFPVYISVTNQDRPYYGFSAGQSPPSSE